VCAVSYTEVQQAARFPGCRARVVSLEPTTLAAVLDSIALVGHTTWTRRVICPLLSQ
jgi:hypothetical protein